MTHPTYTFKKLILAGGTMFSMLAVPLAVNTVTGLDLGVISAAQAAEDGGSANKGKGSASKGSGQKGSASASKGGKGKGGAASNKVFRIPVAEEDSDRPVWAGVKGGKAGGGGKPGGAGTKKGDLFGDMVVLLRDSNGKPILTSTGLVQVIAYVYDASGNLIPLKDASGNPVVIPYNAEGDLLPTVTIGTTTYDVYGAEVELGRLSVARAPEKVLNHSLDEALSKLTATGVVIGVDAAGRLTVNGVAIDSPLENLALYDKYMTTGSLPGVTLPATFNPAALLAAAADKTGSISVDTVVYMDSILGINNLATGTYHNFDTYNYDRYTTWKDATATVLVLKDGVYVPTVVNLYETLFNSTNWADPTPAVGAAGADDFAAAADDYLTVIQFIHDNAVR